ncbi:hypothetical protein BFG52_04170 [Acinetobacter larvae]|uniref:DUF3298 domain-containing protein n=2 Tax=Acinetobacter larvae TaxID=1789224 RepID=A0A1B2LXL5_9GAMM|nr:hypothetical protein BFG52_04170 [Acinetobacter larvae]
MLGACQEKPETQVNQQQATQSQDVQLIQSQNEKIADAKAQFCDEDGCTLYDLQTVKTNLPWLNDYFKQRFHKDLPDAFTEANTVKTGQQKASAALSQSRMWVRYVGQNQKLATFVIQTYLYGAGAAHGMSHQEYVNFDLSSQQRLSLDDIILPGRSQQLLKQLYDANSIWLQAHQISPEKLELSDNFYYGANGIVFVYPLYELASYAEGMSELTLPYSQAQALMKKQYLPTLPTYLSDEQLISAAAESPTAASAVSASTAVVEK